MTRLSMSTRALPTRKPPSSFSSTSRVCRARTPPANSSSFSFSFLSSRYCRASESSLEVRVRMVSCSPALSRLRSAFSPSRRAASARRDATSFSSAATLAVRTFFSPCSPRRAWPRSAICRERSLPASTFRLSERWMSASSFWYPWAVPWAARSSSPRREIWEEELRIRSSSAALELFRRADSSSALLTFAASARFSAWAEESWLETFWSRLSREETSRFTCW